MDNKIINSKEYQDIIDTHNVFLETKNVLEKYPSGLNLQRLSDILNIPTKYLQVILKIYHEHWCTFFKHGRIVFYPDLDKYIYLSKEHHNIREHIPILNFMKSIIKKNQNDNDISLMEEIRFLKQQLQVVETNLHKISNNSKVCKICKNLL